MATKDKNAAEPLRKITVATVCGDVKAEYLEALLRDKTKPIALLDIWGVATRAKPGESDFGPYVKFLGQFKALNIKDGALYRAPTCLLPKFLEEELYGALSAPGASSAEFGFRVSVKYDKDSATSYVFLADSLVEPANNDALAALELKMGEARRTLPAPKK